MERRRALACIGGALTTIALGGCAGGSPPLPTTKLAGTQMNGKVSPDFSLLDHNGDTVALSALRGKPVVLTFLYTNCPDTCPIVTAKFATLVDRLGERSGKVAFVAVSVDPERDVPPQVERFLRDRGLLGVVTFLGGDRAALEAVWKAYAIGVNRLPIKAGSADSRRYGAYAIGHTDALYVLDELQRQRAFLRSDFAVDDMLSNLETLLRE